MESLLKNLDALGRGQHEFFDGCASELKSMLLKGQRLALQALESKAMDNDMFSAIQAMDMILNMLSTTNVWEPELPQWHTVGITLLVKGPSLLGTLPGQQPPAYSILNLMGLQEELRRLSGLAPEAIKVDPRIVSARIAYLEDAVDCHQRTIRSRLTNPSTVTPAASGLVPFGATTGDWTWQELVVFVNVFGTSTAPVNAIDAWKFATYNKHVINLQLHTQIPLELAGVLENADGPWTIFSNSLHTGDAFLVRTAVKKALHQAQLEAEDLVLTLTEIGDEDRSTDEYRVSIQDARTGTLLGGAVIANPFEPRLLVDRLETMCVALGCNYLRVTENKYFDIEVMKEGDTEPRFFCPGKGWEVPPFILR